MNRRNQILNASAIGTTPSSSPTSNETITTYLPSFDVHTDHKQLTRENMVFLNCCFILTVLGYIWLIHYVVSSLRVLHECTGRYYQWFNQLEGLEQESGKWCRTYWIFEQNNMLLQTLDSPRFWPMDPVAGKSIVHFETRQAPSLENKGLTHYKLPEHHFVGHPSTLTRLLTDQEYLHSVEIYTRLHKSGMRQGEWDKFRQSNSASREGASNRSREEQYNKHQNEKEEKPKQRGRESRKEASKDRTRKK